MKMLRPVILMVDDDSNDQLLVKTAFERIGVTDSICSVNDGAEAVAYLKGTGQYNNRQKFPFPTVVMLDLKMPKMNGFELLRYLKNHTHFAVIPTCVFTSSSDSNDIANAYLFGANAYHVKPSSLELLCRHLKTMHDFWCTCEIPEIDRAGNLIPTRESGKLSEKIPKPPIQ